MTCLYRESGFLKQFFAIALAGFTLALPIQTHAASQAWYLRIDGGGFTNAAIGYKSRAACERVRRDIVGRYKARGVKMKSSCKTTF